MLVQFLSRYHRVHQTQAYDYTWAVKLLKATDVPKTLIFFNSLPALTTAYAIITKACQQSPGTEIPVIRMFHSGTNDDLKNETLADLNDPAGQTRFVAKTMLPYYFPHKSSIASKKYRHTPTDRL